MDRRSTRMHRLKDSQMCVVHTGFVVNAQYEARVNALRASSCLQSTVRSFLEDDLLYA